MTTEKPKQLQKVIDFITVFSNCVEQISKLVDGYNCTETQFNELIGFVEGFFDTAKFKIGDWVQLAVTPDTDNGWRGYKHVLVKGAVGYVEDVEYWREQNVWRYGVSFVNETYVGDLITHHHPFVSCFYFRGESLMSAPPPKGVPEYCDCGQCSYRAEEYRQRRAERVARIPKAEAEKVCSQCGAKLAHD